MLKLRVVFGRDLLHLGNQAIDDDLVDRQLLLPGRDVHICQINLDLLTYREIGEVVILVRNSFQVDVQILDRRCTAGSLELGNGIQRPADIAGQRDKGLAECMDRAFQPLEQVGRHQGLQALLAVSLFQRAFAALRLGVIEVFVFFQTTGLDIVDRCIDGHFQVAQLGEYLIEADDVVTVRDRQMM